MKRASLLILPILILAGLNVVFGQGDDDTPITVETSVVRLNVGVVDTRGRPVTSLDKANFEIFEDGVKQNITRFEPVAAPFSLVIILDMSGSTLGFRQTIQMSAIRFVDALAPTDRVAVIEFYDKVNVRNDFTTDRKVIANSIAVANGRGKTQLYRALDVALNKLTGEKGRRKAIIVLTDGIDSSVREKDRELLQKLSDTEMLTAIKPDASENLNGVLNRADQQGVTIYPLALPTGDPTKLPDPTPLQIAMYKAARSRLQILAERSGGTLNTINRLEEMGRLYAAVAAELRTLYTIEYQSSNEKRDGKWRTIRIEVNKGELVSKTRQGYFAR